MTGQPSTSQYIEQRRSALRAEIARCGERLHDLASKFLDERGRLQATISAIGHDVAQVCDAARDRSLKQAQGGAWLAALTLSAPLGPGWLQLACWGAIILGPAVLALMIGLGTKTWLLFMAAAYACLVRWGRRKESMRISQPERNAIEAFRGLHPLLMAVHSEPSGDAEFPYKATLGSTDDGCGAIGHYRFNEKRHGQQYGATLLGFAGAAGNIQILARLEMDGFKSEAIPFGDLKAEDPRWQMWSILASQVASSAAGPGELARTFLDAQTVLLDEQGHVRLVEQRLETLDGIERAWSDVALPVETLDGILQLVDSFKCGQPVKGILLYGPPGTGKTLIARKLAQHSGCHFVSTGVADLKSEHIGGSGPKVKAVWARCRENAPTILFVDECESVFASRGSSQSDAFGAELVQTFLSEWDGFNQSAGQVLVIGATNRHELIDSAIMSRFTESIAIGAPDAAGRHRILANEFAKAKLRFEPNEDMVRETAGMSGRDIHTLVSKIVARHLHAEVTQQQFSEQVRSLRGKQSTSVERLGWSDLILPENTLYEFKSLGRELVHAEELARLGVSVPRGILLFGPPGTGKTQVARVLANESGLAFIAAGSSELKAGYIGQSGGLVRQLFEKARSQAPCILFLDEIDTVARSRGHGDSFTGEIVAQLLQELDGVATKKGQVFLLGASNHPESIDSALLSRFERKIEIGLPDEAARASILALQLAGKPLQFEVVDACAAMAARTAGLSGRDLQSLVTSATRRALQRAMEASGDPRTLLLTLDDLESSLDA